MSLQHHLALTFVNNIGPVLGRSMIDYFGGAEQVFKLSKTALQQARGIGVKRLEQSDFDEALRRAEKEMAYVEANNIDVLFYTDARYPKRLRNCNDAPLLLYAKNSANLNNQRVISMVGTRKATDYGRNICRQLIEELQEYNVLVVSGLALGIDTAAHRDSLKFNVPTVGVLGHGYDKMYPAANRELARKMQENGGGLLTEYPSGTLPARENFPARNRIVAGMADATIVVEAGIKGGALITAEIANSYNRDVFAFPGRLGDEYSEGCNFLIRNNKAQLLTCVADLAYSMGWEKHDTGKSATEQLTLAIDLSADERLIYDLIKAQSAPIAIDDLTIKTNMPVSQLAMTLLDMELSGYIRSLPGKAYCIS
ncbi:DNA-protecting protein DprA [Mucilaginibacter pallidiroseus]|uniref:DNA-protecting protein DprA n=1 Tax=Mucilaginibacter pallidiroseus TaxID=2599295 RepID=A0A563UCK0_9SPHI|nr:DNA-processing protein DprA [Mucilaginibacter pallidiroseus]TWR29095.1 DNA-protecting protein DprA [Mucilaginibacter pallidiroseus]